MANFEDMEKKIDEMHTAITEQKILMENIVVKKDDCETKRAQIYETINGCAKTQCEKIEKAGKLPKAALLVATAVGSLVALAIVLIVYLLTKA